MWGAWAEREGARRQVASGSEEERKVRATRVGGVQSHYEGEKDEERKVRARVRRATTLDGALDSLLEFENLSEAESEIEFN